MNLKTIFALAALTVFVVPMGYCVDNAPIEEIDEDDMIEDGE